MSSGSSSSRAVPTWAKPYVEQFEGLGNKELAQYQSQGGQNNPMVQAGNTQISDTLAGKYMSPDSNPNLAAAGQAIVNTANQQYQQTKGANNRAANASGMLLSSADAAVNAQTEKDINQNVTGQLANLYGQNYATERQNQLQAVPASINQGQSLYNQALQLAMMYGGMGTSGSSNSSFQL